MILDTLAAMISGAQLPPGKFAIAFARAYRGEKVASVAASDIVCGPMEAALANGMLAQIPTRPTTPIRAPYPIPAPRWCRRRWRRASASAPTAIASCAP